MAKVLQKTPSSTILRDFFLFYVFLHLNNQCKNIKYENRIP